MIMILKKLCIVIIVVINLGYILNHLKNFKTSSCAVHSYGNYSRISAGDIHAILFKPPPPQVDSNVESQV